MSPRRAAGALPLLLLGAAALAGDAPVGFDLSAHDGQLQARVDLATAFPDELQRTFGNGLTNVVTVHVALLPEGGDEPAALGGRELDVLYDVWEESYLVTVKDGASPRGRRLTARSWPELRGLLADTGELALCPVALLGEGRWVLRTRVEVNPVSRELLDRTREFIANPAAGVRGGAPSRSVLGAMASYLLQGSDLGEARHFRTRPFTAREVRPR